MESLFALLWQIQSSMASLRSPHSPSPFQGKQARIEEVPMEHLVGSSTRDTPGPLSPSLQVAPSISLPSIIPASSSLGPCPAGWYPIPATWRIIYNDYPAVFQKKKAIWGDTPCWERVLGVELGEFNSGRGSTCLLAHSTHGPILGCPSLLVRKSWPCLCLLS